MDEAPTAPGHVHDPRVGDVAAEETLLACFDGHGNCLDVNGALCDALGHSRQDLGDDRFLRLVHPQDHDAAFDAYARALTAPPADISLHRTSPPVRLRLERRSGEFALLETRWYAMPADSGPLRIVVTAVDTTESERVLAELQSQAEFHRLLVDRLADGVLLVDRAGAIISANAAAARLLRSRGLVGARARDRLWARIRVDDREYTPEDCPDYVVFATGEALGPTVGRLVPREGPEGESSAGSPPGSTWVTVSAQPIVRPGARHPWAVLVSLHDITALLEAEQRARTYVVELRETLARAAREKETLRRQIASEFHDEPIQAIEAAKLAVGMLGEAMEDASDPGSLLALVEDVEIMLRRAADGARRLVSELRPRALDMGGLLPALASQLRQVSGKGIKIHMRTSFGDPNEAETVRARSQTELALVEESEGDRMDDPVTDGIPDWMEMLLFRCVQRALRNVEQHAGAARVVLDVFREGDDLVTRVADDGIGFASDVLERRARQGHLGVVSMREEITNAGGSFDIGPGPLGGTVVLFRLPLASE